MSRPNLNPRWVIWQQATGERKGWQFIVWINEQWRAFEAETGLRGPRSLHHTQFDGWLLERHATREAAE